MRGSTKDQGFSLIELLVATAVFLIVIAIAMSVIKLGQFDLNTNINVNEVQLYANAAMKFMGRDITNSGQGYLQGSPNGNVNGPLISVDAFRNVTGINLPGPNSSPNSQPLTSLVPYSRVDNLGNGTNSDAGSSDRLTVAYQDEFFAAESYTITNATTGVQISNTFFPLLRGTWQSTSTSKFFILSPSSTTVDPSNSNQNITISYDISTLRPGDLLIINYSQAVPSTTPTPIMAMVTQINGNTISFGTEPIGFNRFSAQLPLDSNGNPDQTLIFPLNRIQNGSDVTVTRIKLYTYLVDVNSHDLIRRRYTYPNSGLLGDAFINDPICQNAERLWFTYNRLVPAVPPAVIPTFTDDISEINPSTDINQVVNSLLPNLQSIRRVNITLIIRSTEIDRRNRRPAQFGIQGSFAPRNISYTNQTTS